MAWSFDTGGRTVTQAIPNLARPYRSGLAPSPTGLLHLGHARIFWTAQKRAQQFGGALVSRNEEPFTKIGV